MRPARLFLIPAVAGALALSGCAGTRDAADPTTAEVTAPQDVLPQTEQAEVTTGDAGVEYNEVDVDYALAMVDSHRQAIAHAELALERGSEQIQGLAGEVISHRGEEISGLADWLGRTGRVLPDTELEPEESLQGLEGVEFDSAWLDSLYVHNNEAIDILHEQLARGVDPVMTNNATVLWEFLAAEMDQIDQLREVLQQ